jgi:hypothetical protein
MDAQKLWLNDQQPTVLSLLVSQLRTALRLHDCFALPGLRARDDTVGNSRLNRHGVAVLVPFHVTVARGVRTEASTEGFSNDYVYCSIL